MRGGAAAAADARLLIKRKDLYSAPEKDKPPPPWIRGLLVLTCTGVSFAHGSNDGQKGMGLIMLILIGILPVDVTRWISSTEPGRRSRSWPQPTQTISFQMDRHAPGVAMGGYQIAADELSAYLKTTGKATDRTFAAIGTKCREISEISAGKTELTDLSAGTAPHPAQAICT